MDRIWDVALTRRISRALEANTKPEPLYGLGVDDFQFPGPVLCVNEGDTVAVGAVIARITEGGAAAAAPAGAAAPEWTPPPRERLVSLPAER